MGAGHVYILRALHAVILPDYFKFASYRPGTVPIGEGYNRVIQCTMFDSHRELEKMVSHYFLGVLPRECCS